MDTVKRVSSGTTYLLRNGKNTVHMSPIELKECNYISYSIYMCVSSVLVVYMFNSDIFCFLLNSESSRNGSKVRRGPFPFIPLATLVSRSQTLYLTLGFASGKRVWSNDSFRSTDFGGPD